MLPTTARCSLASGLARKPIFKEIATANAAFNHRPLFVLLSVFIVASATLLPTSAHAACAFGSTIADGDCQGYLTTTGANVWSVPTDWNSASNTVEAAAALHSKSQPSQRPAAVAYCGCCRR